MKIELKLNRMLFPIIAFFIFQTGIIPVSTSPIIFEQDHHTGISETYTYDENESSDRVKDDHNGRVNWGLSKTELGSESESMLLNVRVATKGSSTICNIRQLSNTGLNVISNPSGQLICGLKYSSTHSNL